MLNQISGTTIAKTKCDIRDCKNDAVFFIPAKGRVGKFFLCRDCFEKLGSDVLRAVTPKSPKSAIKRIADSREEEFYAN